MRRGNRRPRAEEKSTAMGFYLKDIDKYTPLARVEEDRLLATAAEGDGAKLGKVVEANLSFVISVAKEYQGLGLILPDLIQAGNLGLLKAATRFDVSRGVKFISYAVWWIRRSILEALAEESRAVRVPTNRLAAVAETNRTVDRLASNLGRAPTADEIELDLGKTPTHDTWQAVSIDGKNDGGSLLQVLEDESFEPPDQSLEDESLREDIELALSSLKPREVEIIRLYFGLDSDNSLTLEEIGERMNLTRERIRQLKEKALCSLRAKSRSGSLRKYLG